MVRQGSAKPLFAGSIPVLASIYGSVVQWLERCPDKTEVDGSIPSRPTYEVGVGGGVCGVVGGVGVF